MANKKKQVAGIGEVSSDAGINQFNLTIRQSPWYQEWFASKGLNPDRVKLNDQQRQELKSLVEQKTGWQMPGDMKIDPAGNLNEKGGWAGLPTGVKIGIIAAAAAATAGAAGAFGGAGAPGALAGGGAVPTTGFTSAAAAFPGATAIMPTAASSGIPALMGTGATVAGGGTLKRVADAVTGGGGSTTMDRVGKIIGMGSDAASRVAQSQAANREQAGTAAQTAAEMNLRGEGQFQNQQLAQAREEAAQRDEARKALYRASVMKNPQFSVENPRGAPTFSPEMMEGLSNLEKQALNRTADQPQYTTSKMRAPRFEPIEPDTLAGGQPTTMEQIAGWTSPALKIWDIGREIF